MSFPQTIEKDLNMSTHRQLAVRSAILVSLIIGVLAYFVVPAGASDNLPQKNNTQRSPLLGGNEAVQTSPCAIHRDFPDEIYRWCGVISQFSHAYGLDPNLIAALIWQESGGNPIAYSHSGAVGLMQVMPRDGIAEKFECPNGPCFAKRPTIRELEDPNFNVEYGTRMLANLVDRRGSVREALKSYGPMDMGYRYADKVIGIWDRYGG